MRGLAAVLVVTLACSGGRAEVVSVPFTRAPVSLDDREWSIARCGGMLPESVLDELSSPEIKFVARVGVGPETQVDVRLVSMTPYNVVVHETLAEGGVYVDSGTDAAVIESPWIPLPLPLTSEHMGYQMRNSAEHLCGMIFLDVYLRNDDGGSAGSASGGCAPGAAGLAPLALAASALAFRRQLK